MQLRTNEEDIRLMREQLNDFKFQGQAELLREERQRVTEPQRNLRTYDGYTFCAYKFNNFSSRLIKLSVFAREN